MVEFLVKLLRHYILFYQWRHNMQKLKLQEEAEKARELELEQKKILSADPELEDKQKVD